MNRSSERSDPPGGSPEPGFEPGPWPQALRLASLILDGDGRVAQHNEIGAELLRALPPGCWRFGQLRALGPRCAPSIPEAIAACRPDAPVRITALLPGPRPSVAQATLLALAQEEGGWRAERAAQGRFLLLVELPRTDGLQTAQAVAPLFDLSPAEVRVLAGLLEGAAPAAIACATATSLPTVRTHISHLLAKTGTATQTELVVLLRGLR